MSIIRGRQGLFKKFPDATRYKDFRRLLDKEKAIDAVTVGTPDHTHATIAMAAIQRGKHVYCEKPLARTMYEVRKLTEAARKHKVATQLGNQGHSFLAMREFCECLWSGAIGDVREVHAVMGFPRGAPADQIRRLRQSHSVPKTLDWDLWLGPAPRRDYSPIYHPQRWRAWRQFGSGAIGDFVCHVVDPIFWALELGAPTSILAEAEGIRPEEAQRGVSTVREDSIPVPRAGQAPGGDVVLVRWHPLSTAAVCNTDPAQRIGSRPRKEAVSNRLRLPGRRNRRR